jgi:hypothetical protein
MQPLKFWLISSMLTSSVCMVFRDNSFLIVIPASWLTSGQAAQARNYDKKRTPFQFQIGAKVLISHSHFSNLPSHADSAVRKLGPRAYGPFEVIQVITLVSYRLKLPPQLKIHDVIPISRLRPFHDESSRFPSRSDSRPPAPEIIDGEKHHVIEAFVSEGTRYGYPAIRVKYQGYDNSANEWQFVDDLKEDLDPHTFQRLLAQLRSHKPHRSLRSTT